MAQHMFNAQAGSPKIVSSYVFDASRKELYEAYTNPAFIPKWWGPEGSALKVEKMDVKPGGSWRFVLDGAGSEFTFRGVYHDAIVPEKIISTWQFEGAPTIILATTTFEESGEGKTKLTEQMVFQSAEDRDAMMKSGMDEESMRGMMERLASLI